MLGPIDRFQDRERDGFDSALRSSLADAPFLPPLRRSLAV